MLVEGPTTKNHVVTTFSSQMSFDSCPYGLKALGCGAYLLSNCTDSIYYSTALCMIHEHCLCTNNYIFSQFVHHVLFFILQCYLYITDR